MSIIIGMINKDGVLMLSDKKVVFTKGEEPISSQKIKKIIRSKKTFSAIGWVCTDLKTKKDEKLVYKVKDLLNDRERLEEWIEYQTAPPLKCPKENISYLFGVVNGSNDLYYINNQGRMFRRIQYSCIGIADSVARSVIQRYYSPKVRLEEAIRIGYEALDQSIRQYGDFCGWKDMVLLTSKGIVDKKELEIYL